MNDVEAVRKIYPNAVLEARCGGVRVIKEAPKPLSNLFTDGYSAWADARRFLSKDLEEEKQC